jgi:hypothetical protein
MRNTLSDQSRENPFDLTKASDYSDRQVQEYWVDVASGKHSLVDFLKPTSLVPMLLLGGKGSGKTHLMRYCSSTVQELRHSNLRSAIADEKYLGMYTSADGLNVHRFSGKGHGDDVWETVFAYSFELWLVGGLLASLRPALVNDELLSPEWNNEFVDRVLALLHITPKLPIAGFDGLISYLGSLRSNVDLVVNNTAITKQLTGIEVTFNPGDLVFGIPKIVADLCSFASSTIFVYLIDEVENFTERQQRFLNSLVRYRKGNATLRIGARLYGIKTYATLGSGEPIKRDAEFEPVILDARLREDLGQYEILAAKLVLKRLEAVISSPTLTEATLPQRFAELSSENYYQDVALEIVAARDAAGIVRPHLARLKDAATRLIADKAIVEALVDQLSLPAHPLLEKVNLLAFYKRISKGSDALAIAKEIHAESKALLLNGPKAAVSYYDLYSHFSSDLLAQLYRDYGRKPIYAGFKTMVRLSQGVPRNLLSLLKHIYRRSKFAGENPFVQGLISVDTQVQGIQDAAEWFWEDAQPDAHGSLVRNAVEHLVTLLRAIRYSDNPSECDLCCFLVNRVALSKDADRALKMAENWSFIVHVSGNSNAKNDDRVLSKFQINPMLAARWGISESRRGAIELKGEFAELLLAELDHTKTQQAINSRVEAMNLPRLLESSINAGGDKRQTGLFDGF